MNNSFLGFEWFIIHLPNSRGTRILFTYDINNNDAESIMTGVVDKFKITENFIKFYIKDSSFTYTFDINKFINEYTYLEEEFGVPISNIKIIKASLKQDISIEEIIDEN